MASIAHNSHVCKVDLLTRCGYGITLIPVDDLYRLYQTATGVSIDSRTIGPGQIFFALPGLSHHGHDFVDQALAKGAALAVVDDPVLAKRSQCYGVPNTLQALQWLAKRHRQSLHQTQFVVIAGSNGKTTTKDLTYAILNRHTRTTATAGNFNNGIGVPLTVLGIAADCAIALIEIGANRPGEHLALCDIVAPHYGIVTNCGSDHLAGYGSIHGVIDANCEVYRHLESTHGTIIVNAADTVLVPRLGSTPVVKYAQDPTSATVRVSGHCTALYPTLSMTLTHHTTPPQSISIHSSLYGDVHADTILAAACISLALGASLTDIAAGVASYVPQNNRSQRLLWGSNTVLLDAYNANPTSMRRMIAYFANMPAESKMLILGDMLDLGAASEAEHAAIRQYVTDLAFDTVIWVGPLFQASPVASTGIHLPDVTALTNYLHHHPLHNTHILVKGSRGLQLERAFAAEPL